MWYGSMVIQYNNIIDSLVSGNSTRDASKIISQAYGH